LNDEGQTKGQQQAIKVVKLVELLEHRALDDHPGGPDHDGRDQQSQPVIHAQLVEAKPGHEGAQHVLGAMREVDDVQQAEDHGQSQRKQRIKGPVDESDQQLPEQRLRGNAKNFHG